MELLWFIPTHGDGRYLATSFGGRECNFCYFQQLALAVDNLGFSGALLPTGRSCEDAWILASSLISITRKMYFLVAIRPGLMSPGVAARMASTFDRLSNGRLQTHVVTGGDPVELAGDGVHLSHDQRYELTDEFLTVWKEILSGHETNFSGNHLHIKGGRLLFLPVQSPRFPIWFGGSSSIAKQIAAKHADIYLTWGETPQNVAEKIKSVQELAAQQGRTIRFGIRLHIIVRETATEAWEAANQLIKFVDDEAITNARKIFDRMDSQGQQRMTQLHNGSREVLEISPNLWAGVGLVRGGAGTALVGDPDTVVARMLEYAALGIDIFILSGYPHLEEAYRVAELLFPRLPIQKINNIDKTEMVSPVGELIGFENFPK